MFDINNSRDFYQKLLEDFDDYMEHQDSARHAMNCAITAHHLADWVWGDFSKDDDALKAKLEVKDIHDFRRWIDTQTVWYGVVQGLSNGSKHFIRKAAEGTHKIGGFGMGGFGQGPYGMSYLAIEVSDTDPKLLPVSLLLEVVIRFWRDFLKQHGPYDSLPKGKVTLMDEALPAAPHP
ncbi:hypothetical protein [Bradyrhizobium sp. NC92]|uniref:hypothetical protein n=1 Tax=Bradyrhizobium sp. (strain NC92) TaxID=55395 RepID=UPI0021AA7F10|nr:hypothetical protein [Bradyrhizobium sp. NC92]UWU66111.1 hypothetical protein N2602_22945 [Bradyrhizobium sp. NC92]